MMTCQTLASSDTPLAQRLANAEMHITSDIRAVVSLIGMIADLPIEEWCALCPDALARLKTELGISASTTYMETAARLAKKKKEDPDAGEELLWVLAAPLLRITKLVNWE